MDGSTIDRTGGSISIDGTMDGSISIDDGTTDGSRDTIDPTNETLVG
jgi:hypothetical protein